MIKTNNNNKNNKQLLRLFTIYCFTLLLSLISTNAVAADPTNTLKVTLISGATDNPISGYLVSAYEQRSNGSLEWVDKATTNSQGIAAFLLPDLTDGNSYVLQAKNPFDQRFQYSEVPKIPGTHTFVLGNKLLRLNVINGITKEPLRSKSIDIYKRIENNKLTWERKFITNDWGHFKIDLPGLGKGVNYVALTRQLYGTGEVYSKEITQTGGLNFKVGNLQVKLVSGASQSAITNHKVAVYERLDGNENKWAAETTTDGNGLATFHVPGLGEGRQYVIKAINPFDSRYKTSSVISQIGKHTFALGHKLLNVHLINAITRKDLANIEVTAYLRKDNGSLEWFRQSKTNNSGRIDFELPGLGNGTVYVLKAYPYGSKIQSSGIKETGNYDFPAGHVPVQLINEVTGNPFSAKSLSLFENDSNGNLIWHAKSKTNTQGIVHFDPVGLDDGRVYVVKATNLFGNNKNYYSRWIKTNGKVVFTAGPDSPHSRDLEPPKITAISPKEGATLADMGFVLKMRASDNQSVDRLVVRITDPLKGTSTGVAKLQNGEWQFTATKSMLSADQTIAVAVDAFDKVGNETTIKRNYKIIKDLIQPEIIVSSHKRIDQINERGFFLQGSVSDNAGTVNLLATVTDPIRGVIVNNKKIEIGKNGNWALAVRKLSRKETVIVKLTATDISGNRIVSKLYLKVMTEAINASQLLNRITFGSTPELLTEVQTSGAESFLSQQLNPESIDDSLANSLLAKLNKSDLSSRRKLQYRQIIRAIYSKRQLLEVMTWFWENHFNTDLSKVSNTKYEDDENDDFRENALGNFRDLLQVSASSPAMLIYLDNKVSRKEEPNENYARELMELHTLGVDNFYTAKDVSEVARVFTGWRVRDNHFFFDYRRHDYGNKTVLGETISADTGRGEGEQVLDILANHKGTANFICLKLLRLFVSDNPSSNSIKSCANDFISNANQNDQIAQVLNGIFHRPVFSLYKNFHNKIKTPLEFVIGFARQLPLQVSYHDTENKMSEMGMRIFYNPIPTGYAEVGESWVDSNQLLLHWQFPAMILYNRASERVNHLENADQFFTSKGIETAEGIVGYLFALALSHNYSPLEWNLAMETLKGKNQIFDIYAHDADKKIRDLMATVFSFPSYQLQ